MTHAGFETWCVGGAVRDALLGLVNQDWDLATAARPEQMRKLFRRTVPLGIEFGTVGVLDRHEKMHEVTTFRRDVKHDGRHAVVEFGASLSEDLRRRDFTVNAIAYDPFGRTLFDPFEGRADLEKKLIRAVGVPLERFVEDRLRVLRGIRFASRFGFAIEPDTWQAIVNSAPHLGRLSWERVKQELDKTLEQAPRPSEAFVLWQRAEIFANLIPALNGTAMTVLLAVDAQPQPLSAMTVPRKQFRRQMRLATLFSDCTGVTVTKTLSTLRAPKLETTFVGSLVERWQFLQRDVMHALTSATPVPDATLRRWAAAIGRTRVQGLARIVWARWKALRQSDHGEVNNDLSMLSARGRNARQLYRRILHVVAHDPIEIADLAVDGDDLRMVGIPDGPHVGTLLRDMLSRVVHDPAENTRDALLAYAIVRFREISDQQPPAAGR